MAARQRAARTDLARAEHRTREVPRRPRQHAGTRQPLEPRRFPRTARPALRSGRSPRAIAVDDGTVQAALNRPRLQRAAHVAGAVLCVVALVLLVRRGAALGDALGEELLRIPLGGFALALAAYVAGGLLLAFAWSTLVRIGSSARLRRAPLIVGHLRSQLAKYLPGNVFHLAWRHLAARREGAGHRSLALALALETVLLLTGAAILALGVVSDPRIDALAPWVRALVWSAPLL